ncbi:discoidin domain-containing protein [Myxococcus sp. MISCRS1]|uniref:discoidin domain-containing protein n=1 Tax=unclassified Myxococcus TaxID=2648731 RepID=UPI001CBE61F9|nr:MULTISPECIES: discoidin domain-containing protein [unclassified Myxococcus]MBZ4394127.1 discoidin domain-containing protein [Myxococcus sp. AS-1-15]MCY1001097.1 discoidin domain-containing protein [Myxococcus sp. MISCRS1]
MRRIPSRLCTLVMGVLLGCGTPEEAGGPEALSRQAAALAEPINVTLHKPATASATQGSFLPEYAVDGDINSDDSRWCPGVYNETRLLDIDLQGTFDLVRMELYTGFRADRPIKSYELFYDDGTGWKPIPGASQTNNTSIAVSTTFTQPVTAKKVRFSCKDPLADNCRVKELWVFGTPHATEVNIPPVANAGPDQAITLPTNSVTFSGGATDADGTVVSLAWTQVSGPTATLSGVSTATLSVTGLTVGTAVFRLTATDNDGATGTDEVSVTVAPAPQTLTNVALGKPVSAGSSNANLPPSNAVDGNLTTRWESGYHFQTHNYFDVDLGSAHEVHGATLHLSTSATSSYAMTAFELQSWDGGCWKTIPGSVVEGNPTNTTQRSLTFTAPVTTTKVRVVCKDQPYCRLRELELSGRPGVASTAPTTCAAGQQTLVRNVRYDYALFLPQQYNADRTTRWPLIIALHGLGGATLATDRSGVLANPEGLARQFNSASFRAAMKAIVISPNQRLPFTNSGTGWFNNDALLALVEDAKKDYRVDTDRIYFTGLSGGANRSLEQGITDNGPLAAIVPIAFTSTPTNDANVCNLKALPIWSFQGEFDTPSRPSNLKNWLDTRCGAGSSAMRFTVIPGGRHDGSTWDTAYATLELYDWLLQQRRSHRP